MKQNWIARKVHLQWIQLCTLGVMCFQQWNYTEQISASLMSLHNRSQIFLLAVYVCNTNKGKRTRIIKLSNKKRSSRFKHYCLTIIWKNICTRVWKFGISWICDCPQLRMTFRTLPAFSQSNAMENSRSNITVSHCVHCVKGKKGKCQFTYRPFSWIKGNKTKFALIISLNLWSHHKDWIIFLITTECCTKGRVSFYC